MYVRQVEEQTLTFRVSGKLWMRSLVMSDLETNTEWSHLLGRAMAGKLKGKVAPTVGDRHDDLGRLEGRLSRDNRAEHAADVAGILPRLLSRSGEVRVWISGRPFNVALPMQSMLNHPVHQFAIDGESLLATFDKASTATRLFSVKVDDRELDFKQIDDQQMQDTQTGSRWRISNGEAIGGELKGKRLTQRVGIMSFRKAWQNFHPDSKDVEF